MKPAHFLVCRATILGFLVALPILQVHAAEPVKPAPAVQPLQAPPAAAQVQPGQPPVPSPVARPPGAGAAAAPGVPLPQGPQIREFSGPGHWIPGETLRLGWRVDASMDGTPVSYVGIYSGETVVQSPLGASGSHELRPVSYPVGAGALVYTLRATDRNLRVSTRELRVPILSAQWAVQRLQVSLQASPREFRAGTPIDFTVMIQSETWPMTGLNIQLSHGGRVVASLAGFNVVGPTNPARLRDAGFSGEAGEYLVDIEFRGQHQQKRFATYAVPYYSLTPAR